MDLPSLDVDSTRTLILIPMHKTYANFD
jgi:hypothetical protein